MTIIVIDPLTCPDNSDQRIYLDHLLNTLRQQPDSIMEKIVSDDGSVKTESLSSKSQKLEKYQHQPADGKKKSPYKISYLLPSQLIDQQEPLEIHLSQPMKLQQIELPEYTGDAYVVMNGLLGLGSFAQVKSGNIAYWRDNQNKLHQSIIPPVARKILKVEKLIRNADEPTDTVNTYTCIEELNKMLDLEVKTGAAYLGKNNTGLYTRKNSHDLDRFEIFMPKFPATLDKMIADTSIGKLSYSRRLFLIRNIALEIQSFHEKTGMAHHDIKPGNITIDPANLSVKLIDYGLANKLNTMWTGGCTPGFLDSRLINYSGRQSKEANDYFSFAIVAALILVATSDAVETKYEDAELSLVKLLAPFKHQTTHDFSMLRSAGIYLNEEIVSLLEHMTSTSSIRPCANEIIRKLDSFQNRMAAIERAPPSDDLKTEQQYQIARVQLLATCSNETRHPDLREYGYTILNKAHAIKSENPDASIPKLTNALYATKNIIENPAHQQAISCVNAGNDLAKHAWGKILGRSLICIAGIATICISLTILLASSGACAPISILGITLGINMLATWMSFATTAIGAGIASYGTSKLFTGLFKSPPEKSLQNSMDNLIKCVDPTLGIGSAKA